MLVQMTNDNNAIRIRNSITINVRVRRKHNLHYYHLITTLSNLSIRRQTLIHLNEWWWWMCGEDQAHNCSQQGEPKDNKEK